MGDDGAEVVILVRVSDGVLEGTAVGLLLGEDVGCVVG